MTTDAQFVQILEGEDALLALDEAGGAWRLVVRAKTDPATGLLEGVERYWEPVVAERRS